MTYYSRKIAAAFPDVIARVIETLKQQGFGIITTIDMRETFRQKLNVSFRNYTILGACNPQFAYQAISLESHLGVMLPCNVVVQEHENGEVEVSAISPLENIGAAFNTTQLVSLATEVGNRLRTAIDNLHHEVSGEHAEALPGTRADTMASPMQG